MDNPPPSSTPGRLVSLDVLRGFDMFWILGVEELAAALGKASDSPVAAFVATQLDHVAWQGFHFLDLIFPLFVFISGVSLVFSVSRSLETRGRAATLRKAAVRALILFLLGLFCYGGISGGWEKVRWLGVLQRIAICGLAASVAFVFLRVRGLIWLTLGLLGSYWALMCFVPFPGGSAGSFAEGANLANWMDSQFLPGRKWDGDHDPEGLLSTLPAIATALLGVLTGIFLRGNSMSRVKQAASLIGCGALLAAGGWAWDLQFPVIKKLWTSSYVLVAGGYSLAMLGLFLAVVDGAGWRRWATPFIWIGMNPITLYMSHHLIDYEKMANRLGGGPLADSLGVWGPVWIASLVLGQCLVLAWFLHKRGIFLKV